MRAAFLVSTALFWVAVIGFWAAFMRTPADAPVAPAPTSAATFTLAQVARHKTADDCWMAIGGEVYDLTAYVDRHPAEPEIFLPWCGREATDAYKTKTKGRPHSARADQLLPAYRVGALSVTD